MSTTNKIIGKRVLRMDVRARKTKRKVEILRIAANLFAEKSYHDVTMDEIAQKAGIAKGTIYLYFKSKEKLYLEILEDSYQVIEAILEKEIARNDETPEKLRKILLLIFDFYLKNIDILKILTRDETHLIKEHYDFTEHWRLRRINLYKKILEKGEKEGSFRVVNINLTSLIIFGLVRSVMFYYEPDKSSEHLAGEVYSVITKGILETAPKESGKYKIAN